MKKKRKLFVALVTVCALVMGSFAVPSAAAVDAVSESSGTVTESASPAEGTAAPESEAPSILREDPSLRGEYEKHFLMSDGTYQVQVYSQPVHELVDGEWVEIQNTNQNARDSVGTDTTKSNIIDNYVLQGYGVQNKSLDRLYIGNRSAGLTRAYIQFAAMPTIPEGSTITGATMTLYFTSGTSTAANASAYQVTGGEWTSGTIQWSNKPAADVLLHGNIGHNNVTGYTINCLTAVQHWYDGDPTGQNENYGIMLRYYDETTADYNAVYSADYTDETKRPKLEINYSPPVEIIPDGVYYIRSSVGLYLGTSGGTAENTSVRLLSYATNGRAQVYQLWRIAYLGNNYYSIRPMHRLNMGLHVTSNSVDITSTTGLEDTMEDVAGANRWGIVVNADGSCYINYAGTYSLGMTYPNGIISSGMSVITAINSCTSDSFKWDLIKVDYKYFNLEVMYDYSYSNRYPDAVGRINNQITTLQNKYLSEFGVWISCASLYSFSSHADSKCTTIATEQCAHATDDECNNSVFLEDGIIDYEMYHHDNIYNNVLRLPFPDRSEKFLMAYFGHDLCAVDYLSLDIDGDGDIDQIRRHVDSPYNGITYPALGLIGMNNNVSVESEIKTAIHEFGHLFNAPDHYGVGCASTDGIVTETGDSRFNPNCIYGENREESVVLEDYTICEGCQARIEYYLGIYNHG